MRHRRALLVGAVVALIITGCAAYAAGGGESLISRNYLNQTFQPQAVEKGQQEGNRILQETYDAASRELEQWHASLPAGGSSAGASSGTYSEVLSPRNFRRGDAVSLSTGSGFLLTEGQAEVTHTGAVVDITEGREVASGTALQTGHRYLVAEDTTATVTVRSAAAALAVQGSYTAGTTGNSGTGRQHPFTDVDDSAWYAQAVAYVWERNLFQGTDATHFSPELVMNRAMMVTVLHRLAGNPPVTGQAPDYTDVERGSWYEEAVRWSGSLGITTGTEDGTTFSPDLPLTREQALSFLYRYAVYFLGESRSDEEGLEGYQDASQVSSWAREGLSWAVSRGIISSTSQGEMLLSPQGLATRAQMAAMLQNFSEHIM